MTKISELADAGTLTGSEDLALVQGGNSRKADLDALAVFFGVTSPTQETITLSGTSVTWAIPANAREIDIVCGSGITLVGAGAFIATLQNTGTGQNIDRFFEVETASPSFDVTESDNSTAPVSFSASDGDSVGLSIRVLNPSEASKKTLVTSKAMIAGTGDQGRHFVAEQLSAAVTNQILFTYSGTSMSGTLEAFVRY